MKYIGFNLKVKTDTGYTTLYPFTSPEQVQGFMAGEIFGPYVFTLNMDNWVSNQQKFALPDMVATDIPVVVKILTGTEDEMKAQDEAYKLLVQLTGVESLDGEIVFTTTETPESSYQVQVWWTR